MYDGHMSNAPQSGFDGTNTTHPTIKKRDKFVKKVTVPKSGKVSGNDEGDWGRNA